MRHYTLEEWVDFARGVLAHERHGAMQRHLDAPCRPCQQGVGLWQRALARASGESGCPPPEEAVRQVKALFGLLGSEQGRPGPLGLAERIFDSVLQPAPAGLCSAPATAGRWCTGPGTVCSTYGCRWARGEYPWWGSC
jgi:hypothetical protein